MLEGVLKEPSAADFFQGAPPLKHLELSCSGCACKSALGGAGDLKLFTPLLSLMKQVEDTDFDGVANSKADPLMFICGDSLNEGCNMTGRGNTPKVVAASEALFEGPCPEIFGGGL